MVLCVELDSADVDIDKGFKQGRVLAPDLFNLYLDSVARLLEPLLQQSGLPLQYRVDADLLTVRRPDHKELKSMLMTLLLLLRLWQAQ